jgi:hypothetical protein
MTYIWTKYITKDGRKWLCRWYINGHLIKTTDHKTKREAESLTLPPETRHTR